MSHPFGDHALNAAKLKVIRAKKYFDEFKREADRYVDRAPYDFIRTKINGNRYRIRTIIKTPPPIILSLLVGDCVNNARASLDYIAWELAARYFTPPPTLVDRGWISFPIFLDIHARKYVEKLRAFKNRKVPAGAIDEIRAVQPKQTGYESLWWLNELVNEDKHRMPLLTVGAVESTNLVVGHGAGPFAEGFSRGEEPIDLTLTAEHFSAQGHMQVDIQITGFVAWQNPAMPREPAVKTLGQIVKTVWNVIRRFDRFF